MNKDQAFNVVSLIQQDPFFYRNFGVYWYHVKKELKRLGYDRDQLSHLGDFSDPIAEAYYEGKTREQLDREAFEYQYAHTFHKFNGNQCSTPDGETYLLMDQDAE